MFDCLLRLISWFGLICCLGSGCGLLCLMEFDAAFTVVGVLIVCVGSISCCLL